MLLRGHQGGPDWFWPVRIFFSLPGNGVLGREMCVTVCSDGFFSLCLDFENTGESSVSGAKCGTPLGAWAELGSP